MVECVLKIEREAVMREVSKTSAYAGAKTGDASLYERMATTAADGVMLERFWEEAKCAATGRLKEFAVGAEERGGVFEVRLRLPDAFKVCVKGSMEKNLQSFFVMSLLGKWLALTDKEVATDYAAGAGSFLDAVVAMTYARRRPRRWDFFN